MSYLDTNDVPRIYRVKVSAEVEESEPGTVIAQSTVMLLESEVDQFKYQLVYLYQGQNVVLEVYPA